MLSKQDKQELLDEISGLRQEIAELRGERAAMQKELGLGGKVTNLREELETLRIEKSRMTEEHEREKREVEHMVGLEKKRQVVELDQAKREATLAVREENLDADKERFDKHVEFIEKRFGTEVGYLKEIMVEVLGRLPKIEALVGSRAGDE